MNTQCPHSKQLSALIDGELPEDLSRQVMRHMDDCRACRNEFGRLTSIHTMLRGMREIEPSPQFERTFWKKINAIKEKKRNRRPFQNFVSWAFRPSWAAAAAVAAIVAGIIFSAQQNTPRWNPVDISISQDLELYSEYEMIDQLDLLENWDEIMAAGES
jgi:anti-sigma factor RsiW